MIPVAIVGGGLAGIVAALSASEVGCKVVLFEKSSELGGANRQRRVSIPGVGTRYQKLAGVIDSPQNFARDIQIAAGTFGDPLIVETLSERAANTIEWLTDRFGIPFELEADAAAGHTSRRMHSPMFESGGLADYLAGQLEDSGVAALTGVQVKGLHFKPERHLFGLDVAVSGKLKTLPCDSVILANGGFGHSQEIINEHLPLYSRLPSLVPGSGEEHGISWIHLADGAVRDMSSHSSSIMIAEDVSLDLDLISKGAVIINNEGERFTNEVGDWKDMTGQLARQSEASGWVLLDDHIHRSWQDSEAYKAAVRAGSIRRGRDSVSLASAVDIPAERMTDLLNGLDNVIKKDIPDAFGRKFSGRAMRSPWFAVRIEARLLGTHGGVVVDPYGAVMRTERTPLPGLFAAGEMISGLAGPGHGRTLVGNDMLNAIVMGRIAGETAAQTVRAAA